MVINQRTFLASSAALAGISACPPLTESSDPEHGFPASVVKSGDFVQGEPLPGHRWASNGACEAFRT
jgi:hypothetical protein